MHSAGNIPNARRRLNLHDAALQARANGRVVTPIPSLKTSVMREAHFPQSQKNSVLLLLLAKGFASEGKGWSTAVRASQRNSFPSRKCRKRVEHSGLAHFDSITALQLENDFFHSTKKDRKCEDNYLVLS